MSRLNGKHPILMVWSSSCVVIRVSSELMNLVYDIG
jgi:hypothetical protein